MMLCFIIALFVVKIIEIVAVVHFGAETIDFGGAVYGNLISCGFVSLVVFMLYLPLSLFSKKTAQWTASILFGLMLLCETGLLVYHSSTGLLMGKELIVRPLWETIQTVKSFANVFLIITVIVLLICFVVFLKWISDRKKNNIVAVIMAVIMLISTPLFFILKPNHDETTVNKTWHFVRECLKRNAFDINFTKNGNEIGTVDKYLKLFSGRQVIDKQYPLERRDNIKNVLGPYFKTSNDKPNVVIIIVESLGADIFGVNECGYCYTPFLDSLSEHSLLWTNCLATTPRSFGAVPAITGSVPHGLKGFQFGDIPEHNSIISILKNNGYKTNAFYAGNFSFDRVYDYLVEQEIDYMSPFYAEYHADDPKTREGTYWGYHDAQMFAKSLEIIEKEDENQPCLDIFVTISQHEDLMLKDKTLEQRFYDEAKTIFEAQPKRCRASQKDAVGKLAATLYTDDAIRKFINGYNNDGNHENTIFVITGDHSMNFNDINPLDAFHVPLIIWSPLLERPDRFEALVSHNDIAPSLTALLHENFGLKTPKTVHWVSDGLDTSHKFRSEVRTYFLRYSREVYDFIYDNYYFTKFGGKDKTYLINSDLSLSEVKNDNLAESLNDKFLTMVSVDNYVYSNNKLTANPLFPKGDFNLIDDVVISDSIFCASKSEKPSVMKPEAVMIYQKKFDGEHQALKLVVTADVKYTGRVWQDQFTNIVVECMGGRMQKIYSSDYVSKYIMERDLKRDTWLRFELSKLISTENSDDVELKLNLFPTHKDEMWDPEHTITMKNVEVKVFDVRNQ